MKILLFVVGGAVAYFFITFNARFATRELTKAPVLWRVGENMPPVDITRSLKGLIVPISAFTAFLFAVTCASTWMSVLQVSHRSSFGVVDPVFGRDIGYYVFALPAIASLLGIMRGLVIFTLIASLFLHLIRGRVTLPPARIGLEAPA